MPYASTSVTPCITSLASIRIARIAFAPCRAACCSSSSCFFAARFLAQFRQHRDVSTYNRLNPRRQVAQHAPRSHRDAPHDSEVPPLTLSLAARFPWSPSNYRLVGHAPLLATSTLTYSGHPDSYTPCLAMLGCGELVELLLAQGANIKSVRMMADPADRVKGGNKELVELSHC